MANNTNQSKNFEKNRALDEKAFEQFAEDLIKAKNSPDVNNQNRGEIKENLMRDLSDAINKKLLDAMTDEQVEGLNKLLDANESDEKVSGYFASQLPNMQQLITETLLDFRKGYLSVSYNPNAPSFEEMAKQEEANAGGPPPLTPAPVANDKLN